MTNPTGFFTSAMSAEQLTAFILNVLSGNGDTITGATITGSTVDSSVVGGTTPAAVHATTLSATGVASLSNVSVSMTGLPTADPHVVGRLWTNTHVLTVSAG